MKQQSNRDTRPLDEGAHSPAPTSLAACLTATTAKSAVFPADPAAIGSGPDRRTGPAPRESVTMVMEVRSDSPLHPDFLAYAAKRTRQALAPFDGIRVVDLVLAGAAGGPSSCRVHVDFIGGPAVVVGHCGGEMLSAIETALDTTAHIVASRTQREA